MTKVRAGVACFSVLNSHRSRGRGVCGSPPSLMCAQPGLIPHSNLKHSVLPSTSADIMGHPICDQNVVTQHNSCVFSLEGKVQPSHLSRFLSLSSFVGDYI